MNVLSLTALLLAASPAAHRARPPAPSRTALAKKAFKLAEARYKAGMGSIESVHTWSLRWARSQQGAAPATARAAAVAHRDRMRALADLTAGLFRAGRRTELDELAAQYFEKTALAEVRGRR